jgi:hypothetical protein
MKDRDLINLIVEKSRADGRLFINLSENKIWSNHFGWGFGRVDENTFETLNVRIMTDGHVTNGDVVHSVRLGWFDMRYAKREFDKLMAEQENQEKDKGRGMLESFLNNLGCGE